METEELTYTVTLRDYPEALPERERAGAERRYAKALDKAFGSAAQVAAALDTLRSLEESPPEVVPPADLALLRHWGKASTTARQAAFQGLGEAEGAYFDVHLVG
ncbi:hypothetical protein [Paracidovorax valerianellae]|uniref:Uncharacterized protein n=1 Tax=Paracidovorax valerianellae TaxID=187868 RepID=A0A1G7A0G1_9BURK|nr:hypothetical protein [Paracidovorax valerianellae]MDA8443790.1 hypothetical protein [Paracidovorax valerianellae]SDE08260.1 hypothetical protein SAMN05192589_11222 [Paracidovorax valerianellae]